MIEFQRAIYDRLDALLSVPVYDHVPQPNDAGLPFEFVTIGEDTFEPFDTDQTIGYTVVASVHTWVRERGRKRTKEIQQQIYNTLHRFELSVSGFDTINLAFEYADSAMDVDGLTRHGVQRFRALLDEDSQ